MIIISKNTVWYSIGLILCIIISPLLAYSQDSIPAVPELIFGEPEPQSFDVFAGNASESTKNRGIIGGGGYYYAVVTIAPRYEFQGDSTVTIFLGGERVSRKVIDRQNPGGLAVLTWSFDLMDMDRPARMVRKVTAYFNGDKTEVSEQQGAGVYIFNIPEGSSKLVSFDVNWAWGRNNTTLSFKGGAGPAGARASYKKWLWPVIIILLLLLLWRLRKLLMPIPVQDKGNRVEKEEEEEEEEEDVCAVMRKSKDKTQLKNSRERYQFWIKKLICDYLETDFTHENSRTAYTQKVLDALRKNVGGGLITKDKNVRYIVTREPARLQNKKITGIKAPMALRSKFEKEETVIGIPETFFHTPKPVGEQQQRAIIPKAETAIMSIFFLKKMSDIIKTNPKGLEESKVRPQVETALTAFRNKYLKQAADFKSITIENVEKAPEPKKDKMDSAKGINITSVPLMGEIKVNKVRVGEALGMTKALTAFATPNIERHKIKNISQLENIEPKDTFSKKNNYAITVAIRTYIKIIVCNGKPRLDIKKVPVSGIKVLSNDGKQDLTDTIAKHEARHAADTREAWTIEVLDAITKRLENVSFSEQLKRKIVEKTAIKINNKICIDLYAFYFFKPEVKSKQLNTYYKKLDREITGNWLRKLRKNFDKKYNKLANEFHKTPGGKGLDGKRPIDPKIPKIGDAEVLPPPKKLM